MKYLKYLLILIAALIIFFFARGCMTPSIEYDSEITVNKPIKEAWAVMSDPSKVPEWLESIQRMEPVSGTPNTVGAVSKIYIIENGEEMVMEETITAIEPYNHMAMTFTMDFMDMDYEMNLEEKDENTTIIKSKSVTRGNGLISKSIVSFMPGAMKAQEDENMKKLKAVIENNTKDYYAGPTLIEEVEKVEQ